MRRTVKAGSLRLECGLARQRSGASRRACAAARLRAAGTGSGGDRREVELPQVCKAGGRVRCCGRSMSIKLRELIRQIRACKTKQEERTVVARECALIRTAFKEDDNQFRHSTHLQNEGLIFFNIMLRPQYGASRIGENGQVSSSIWTCHLTMCVDTMLVSANSCSIATSWEISLMAPIGTSCLDWMLPTSSNSCRSQVEPAHVSKK